jgi:acetyl coenzyme A synthetase (ADP forming)-like protein
MPLSALPDSCDVVLWDGSTVSLRPSRPDDVGAVRAFLEGLSAESRYRRFLGVPRLDGDRLQYLLAESEENGVLLGWCAGRVVALAGFYRHDPRARSAEVALVVADAFQGRGLGTRLLERLADHARPRGITHFDAEVLSDNGRMLEVFRESGFDISEATANRITHVVVSIAPSAAFVEKAAARAQTAAAASMRAFFAPRAVAVVGASPSRGKIGSEILHNLIASGFTGAVFPVHPSAAEIEGHRVYPSVVAIPDPVDLAVIVVPAEHVSRAVDDCIAKGVRGICIISAGFSETGPEGADREREIVGRIRDAGCRLIGPNCMGLLNTAPDVRLNATFSPVYPPAGGVAMSTQSGALGLAILDHARRLNIGISSFVSVGNKADVSGNDLIQYWADDPGTSVILLYLESFGNPRTFTELARRVGRRKPIVAVKSGRSRGGARAASSHTGALAASDSVVDALFRQAGVIRTLRLEEMFDVAALLSHQPLPAGPRVAIVTNAGGPGILAADACEGHGLELAALSDATREGLRACLPASASVQNPVDMLAAATPDDYRRTLDAVLRDDGVDTVIVIFIPPLVTATEAVASAIQAAARSSGKPVIPVMMCGSTIPSFTFPESAVLALSRVVEYAQWRRRPETTPPVFEDISAAEVRRPIDAALARGAGWLTAGEVNDLLTALGIGHAPTRVAATPEDAAAAAAAVGFPVAVKALGPTLLHKTERQAVVLDLRDAAAVREAAADLSYRLGSEVTAFAVQPMVTDGVEMLVGAVSDPLFGPLIVCGAGGILTELLADTATRLHPLTAADADRMLADVRGARLLRGYRGHPPADEQALKDVILRVSALLTLCPEVQEMDLNPVKVRPTGVSVVDARIRVERPRPPASTRRVVY